MPPAVPVPFTPGDYPGSYSGPLATYEVAAAGGGLDITRIPKGFAADIGEQPMTAHYLALGRDRFVAAQPDNGVHPVLAFLHNGRYLYNSRALPKVSG